VTVEAEETRRGFPIASNRWCTPGTGVNLSAMSDSTRARRQVSRPMGLWGASPLYMNPVTGWYH